MRLALSDHLAEYISPSEHEAHATFARMVSEYHNLKAIGMAYRLKGHIPAATKFENKCDKLAQRIEQWEKEHNS